MSSLQSALQELEERVRMAEAASDALAKAVRRVHGLTRAGNVHQLERQLPALQELASTAHDATARLDAEGFPQCRRQFGLLPAPLRRL
jgi:hypothetical protein